MGVISILVPLLLTSPSPDRQSTRGWSNQEVENRLRSTDVLDIAWAAHEAGDRRLKRLIPALLDVLESPPDDEDRGLALEYTLDALIRLGAEIEPRHAEDLYLANGLLRTELLVLIARSPARFESTLIELLDRDPEGLGFHAVVSLLSKIRSPRLAARLLPKLETHLSVTVHDPDALHFAFGSGCGGFGLSGGSSRASFWPPPFDYELRYLDDELDEEDQGGTPFDIVSSPRAITALRLARSPTRIRSGRPPSHASVVEHLVHLAGLPPGSVKIPALRRVSVGFESAAQVHAFVEVERGQILAEHDRLRQTLATRGLLDRALFRATALRLNLHVEDVRSDKSTPLDP